MKLVVTTFVSLDGVMQGPGGRDEDRSGGFDLGGWLMPHADQDFGRIVEEWFGPAEAFLLGRTTYQLFEAFWPQVTDPANLIAERLNHRTKYVASTSLTGTSWGDTRILSGDVAAAVTELKARDGGELQVHGSAGLVQTLNAAGLVDEYRLFIAPVVLGRGKRLFDTGVQPATFGLESSRTTAGGVTALVLRPVSELTTGEAAVEDGREVIR